LIDGLDLTRADLLRLYGQGHGVDLTLDKTTVLVEVQQ
jgi:hypothetical protein